MRVKVVRAFLLGGKVHQVGSVVDVPDGEARGLIGTNKAEPATEEKPPKAQPMTTENSGLIKGKAKKEETDAK